MPVEQIVVVIRPAVAVRATNGGGGGVDFRLPRDQGQDATEELRYIFHGIF